MFCHVVITIRNLQILLQILLQNHVNGQVQVITILCGIINLVVFCQLSAIGADRGNHAALRTSKHIIVVGFQTSQTLLSLSCFLPPHEC